LVIFENGVYIGVPVNSSHGELVTGVHCRIFFTFVTSSPCDDFTL